MATFIKIEFTCAPNGKPDGKKLYMVTKIDTDDSEDTKSELYRADSGYELDSILKAEYVGDEEDEDIIAIMEKQFDDDLGTCLLYEEVGDIIQ